MKILVIANDLIIRRLTYALKSDGIAVDFLLVELPLILETVKSQQYDLVIVDSLHDNVEEVCEHIYELDCTPVSLILSEKADDWKTISTLKVDGFLAKEASDTELRTRIKATCRRNHLVKSRA